MSPAAVDLAETLRLRLAAGRAALGVVGLGYVGLPLSLAAAGRGLTVLGLDVDPARAAQVNAGASPLAHIDGAAVAAAVAAGRLAATADLARVAEVDAVLLCVPTPLGRHREPDLSFVEGSVRAIAPHLAPGRLVVLESTTWPGTTREVVRPLLEAAGLRSEVDVFLAYSPEREDPGNRDWRTGRIPKVVGGDGPLALELATALYRRIVDRVVPVSSTAVAEAVKLTENVFRAVNIALVNELKTVLTAMGIDVWEVIAAAATKPFGYMPFWPGPGLGGHCIPIDPFYLTWKAKELGLWTRFVELAGEINTAMPGWVLERLALALDARFGKGLNGARILVVGVAYKRNIDDVRESPALVLIERLEGRGAVVAYHDPHVPEIPPTREHRRLAGRRSLPLAAATLEAQDAVLIVTDHDAVDWPALVAGSRLVVDTRNATRAVATGRERIVMA
jgi:UDP-N-acetyl-D-glucosamine dehydrogenase